MSNLKFTIKKVLLFGLIILATMYMCFYFSTHAHNNPTKETSNINIENKYIQTVDNYDSNGISITEFFKENDALNRMKNLHNDLINNKLFDVLEVNNQYIEKYSKEKYKNGIKFVYTEEKELMNQIVKRDNIDEYMTPLKAVQISESSNNLLDLKKSMQEGKFFEKDDYELNSGEHNEISVILGNAYIDIYKIGDIFEGDYLSKKFNFKVKGFLKKDTFYDKGGTSESLDTSIVMPFLNCKYDPKTSEDYMFQCILYSMKSTPYIKYDTKQHYNQCIYELKRLYKKNKVDYSYVQPYND